MDTIKIPFYCKNPLVYSCVFTFLITFKSLGQYISDPSVNLLVAPQGQIQASTVSENGRLYSLYLKNQNLYLQIFDQEGFPILQNSGLIVDQLDPGAEVMTGFVQIETDENENAYVAYRMSGDITRFRKISSTGVMMYYRDFEQAILSNIYHLKNDNSWLITYYTSNYDSTTYVKMTDDGTTFIQHWSKQHVYQNNTIIEKNDGGLYLVSYEMLQVPPYGYIKTNVMSSSGDLIWTDWKKCFDTEAFVLYSSPLEASLDNDDNLYIFKSIAYNVGHLPKAQKVSSIGNVEWGSDGIYLLNPSPNASCNSIQVIYDSIYNEHHLLISAENTSVNGYIYFQTIESDGTLNSTNGTVLATDGNVQSYFVKEAKICNNNIVFTYLEYPSEKLSVSKIDFLGNFVWVSHSLPICTTTGDKGIATIEMPNFIDDQIIVIFGDDRLEGNGYAQKISCEGSYASVNEVDGLTKLSVFPNPSKGKFEISGENLNNEVELILTTLNGKNIPLNYYKNNGNIVVDYTGNNGLYFLSLTDNVSGETKTMKLIKD